MNSERICKDVELRPRVWHRIDIYASILGKKCVIDLPVDKKRDARYCRILMFHHNGMNFWILSNRQQEILTKSTYLAHFLGMTWSLMQQSSVKPARNQSVVMTRSNPGCVTLVFKGGESVFQKITGKLVKFQVSAKA